MKDNHSAKRLSGSLQRHAVSQQCLPVQTQQFAARNRAHGQVRQLGFTDPEPLAERIGVKSRLALGIIDSYSEQAIALAHASGHAT